MKIVVIGQSGYVGPVLVEHLRAIFPAAELVGLDTGYFLHCTTTTSPTPEALLDCNIDGDARDLRPTVVEKADAVIYLAAISNDPMGEQFADPTFCINRDAAVSWAQTAKRAGVEHFVYASSCSVYGSAEDQDRTETSATAPLTAYARSKVEAEDALLALATPDFQVSALRFATACGMSPRLRLDLVLNDFVASALVLGRIDILSDGTPWRPLIDVQDMARAFAWAASRSIGDDALVVNVGSNTANYQVRELAEEVACRIPGTIVNINPNAAPDKRSYRVDFSRFARLAPEAVPQLSLTASVDNLIRGLRSVGFKDKAFRASELMRLNVLRSAMEQGRLDQDLRWRT